MTPIHSHLDVQKQTKSLVSTIQSTSAITWRARGGAPLKSNQLATASTAMDERRHPAVTQARRCRHSARESCASKQTKKIVHAQRVKTPVKESKSDVTTSRACHSFNLPEILDADTEAGGDWSVAQRNKFSFSFQSAWFRR